MSKLLKHLCMFFSPHLVFGLMQFIIRSEREPLQGVEKKTLAEKAIKQAILANPSLFGTSALNPAIPWDKILPLLVDLIIKILNELFGHKWIDEVEPEKQKEE